jgi:hypothetical protein
MPDGRLKVDAQVDWGGSKPLFIDAAPNQKIEHTRSQFPALYSITLGFGSHLTLKKSLETSHAANQHPTPH